MSRFLRRTRRWLAVLLVAALVFPIGRWAVDEFAFSASGDAVADELGEDAGLIDAMLLVRSIDCHGRASTGSAFALDVEGETLVVTNRHVVDGARTISVRPLQGGDLTAVDDYRVADIADVAVLLLSDDDALPLPLERGEAVGRGTDVRIVGFPGGRPSTGVGTVDEVGAERLLLDIPVSGGASGSPVLDGDGRVVAQIFGTAIDGRGVATPIDRAIASLGGLRDGPSC